MASHSCNKSFCSNYMLLKPEECSVLDLAKLLLSGKKLGQKDFIDCPNEEMNKEPLSRRWVIFLSILVQKILLATAKPLAGLGNAIEYWLNLQNVNGGFFRLLFKSLICKAVSPDKESAAYLSFIGNLDKRVDLDFSKNVGGRRRYDEGISMMAAKAAYENKAYVETTVNHHWKMDLVGSFDFWNDYQEKATTQAFVLQDKSVDPELIIVAFRGTEFFNSDDWISDFNLSWYDIPGMGKVHAGFVQALGLQKSLGWPKNIVQTDTDNINQPPPAYYFLRKLLKQLLEKNEKARFLVTGHSLGGALAILFPAILAFHEESWLLKRLGGIYTFGQPRVGDESFIEYMNGQLTKHEVPYYRVVYSNDMVPRLPFDNSTFLFKHFGTCIYYNSLYREKILVEEPDKNGSFLLMFIPKMLNAAWELIRSCILPCVHGQKYQEGGLLLCMRVIGLLFPGMPAHCPQDYVNSTRLGSSDHSTEDVAKYQKIGIVPA